MISDEISCLHARRAGFAGRIVDDDVAGEDNWSIDKRIGITAWWQLQHQFGFAPHVTRVIIDRAFEGPAT